jgi:hypothetical protein
MDRVAKRRVGAFKEGGSMRFETDIGTGVDKTYRAQEVEVKETLYAEGEPYLKVAR